MVTSIGIDAGGTLTKVAYMNEKGQLHLSFYPSSQLHVVSDFINAHSEIQKIGLTGGRTEQLKELFHQNKQTNYLVEFEATLKGVKYGLKAQGLNVDKTIITNIGTGTSIHLMNGEEHFRTGGTGVGGGTLVGLASLLTGIHSFEEILQIANKGTSKEIDLLVDDIFEGMELPPQLVPGLTASNFGKVGIQADKKHSAENVLATLVGLVGEVISTLSIQYADQYDTENILYIGTTLEQNDKLKDVLSSYTKLKKKNPIFLPYDGYCGAIGALLEVKDEKEIISI